MSDTAQIHRSVTKIGGTELRPLHLLSQKGSSNDQEVESEGAFKKTLKRRFPVNHNKLSFEPRDKQPKTTTSGPARLGTTSKAQYYEFLVLDQAGKAYIAHDNSKECKLVAIKKRPWKSAPDYACRQDIRDENIVNLIEMFVKDEQIYMIYEQMDVSLDLINGIPRGRWQAFEIAAICKEVLNGICFVHDELNMYHGAIECGSIMFSRDGQIKLANIGDCIQDGRTLTDATARNDIRSVGLVMIELMEPESAIRSPAQETLTHPEVWKDESGIKDFLSATKTQSLNSILKHHFLPGKSNRAHLKPHVFTALIAGKTDWDVTAPLGLEHPWQ